MAAVAASSGQSAQFMAISALAHAGDNIVSTSNLYGGTSNLTFEGLGYNAPSRNLQPTQSLPAQTRHPDEVCDWGRHGGQVRNSNR